MCEISDCGGRDESSSIVFVDAECVRFLREVYSCWVSTGIRREDKGI